MTLNISDSTRPRRFRRTILGTALLQALLPVALSFTPTVTASQDKLPPRSPFSVDRLPSLGSDPAPAPDELHAARQDEQASAVASAASSAGGLLQGTHPGEAAASMARGMATGEASRQVSDWLKDFGNARVQLNMDEKFSLKNSQFDLLHSWWEVPDAMLFSQGSLHRTDDRTQANLGFGWRHWADGSAPYGILSGPYMTGLNTFLDYDLSRDHARLGLGAEFWRDYFKAGANVYHRLTNWKNSPDIEDYEERPADGWDIRMEGWLPAYPQLGAKLVYEQYYGHDVGLFGYDNLQKDPHAFTAGLTWTPLPLLTLSAGQRQGKQGENDSRIGLDFTWHPDMSWQQQTDPDAVGALRTLAGNRHDFIERNNNIVLEYRKKEVLAISLPERVEGKSGMQYPLTVTVSKA
ncbi:inverse autotransporter beta domain-containing protein, partial [Salmonella enterica]